MIILTVPYELDQPGPVRAELSSSYKTVPMLQTSVDSVMTKQLVTLHCNAIISEAAQVFEDCTFHHIPIVNEDGSLAGILSRTDIDRLRTGASLFANPKKADYDSVLFQSMWVRDIMTKKVVEVSPQDTIEKAYSIFKENKFRALPVVDGQQLVGILTPLDILDFFFQKV